jgi:hypothetical protein
MPDLRHEDAPGGQLLRLRRLRLDERLQLVSVAVAAAPALRWSRRSPLDWTVPSESSAYKAGMFDSLSVSRTRLGTEVPEVAATVDHQFSKIVLLRRRREG